MGSVNGQLAARQKWHGGRDWQRIVACLMIARKQIEEGRAGEKNTPFHFIPPVIFLQAGAAYSAMHFLYPTTFQTQESFGGAF